MGTSSTPLASGVLRAPQVGPVCVVGCRPGESRHHHLREKWDGLQAGEVPKPGTLGLTRGGVGRVSLLQRGDTSQQYLQGEAEISGRYVGQGIEDGNSKGGLEQDGRWLQQEEGICEHAQEAPGGEGAVVEEDRVVGYEYIVCI